MRVADLSSEEPEVLLILADLIWTTAIGLDLSHFAGGAHPRHQSCRKSGHDSGDGHFSNLPVSTFSPYPFVISMSYPCRIHLPPSIVHISFIFRLDIRTTSSAAQGGGGSFKNRKPIGDVGCCESGMAERSHWWTERWLELCLLEWLQWLQWSPHPQLLDVVWCTATVVVVVA